MNKVIIYDIKYEPDKRRKKLPVKIVADLDQYQCDTGFGNLNYRSHKAIFDATGAYAKCCKIKKLD